MCRCSSFGFGWIVIVLMRVVWLCLIFSLIRLVWCLIMCCCELILILVVRLVVVRCSGVMVI